MGRVQKHLRTTLLTGIFAAIPLAVTAFVIIYIERATREPVRDLIGWNTPFIGVLLAVAVIYLLGLAVSSIVGKWLLAQIDKLLLRVPVLRDIYQAWKHVSITPGGREGIYAKVVLIPVENDRQWAMGFSSLDPLENDPKMTCVFIPGLPNPVAGRLYFVPIADCRVLDVSVEVAFKVLLSSGNYVPPEVGLATASGTAHGESRSHEGTKTGTKEEMV